MMSAAVTLLMAVASLLGVAALVFVIGLLDAAIRHLMRRRDRMTMRGPGDGNDS
ncbi:hypothetical protein [Pseudohoeflea coraliihabitans]|uniref:Uncharacterized protein n=1 Tax=Pseudohoeflea coraliihabitans TaxID=2860393 RepID=A0ABS6WN48_9HYPH|nr:hypothetical protein [Pseudohoeflea sp. DP4N28-3]MBW3096837.1 hypothetical protein [Pseudohoeflea sp. DP4N28-3]